MVVTKSGKIKAPFTPPPLNNHGKFVSSLQRLTKWMAAQAEELGVQVFGAFPGQELLWDGDRVIGVRTGDKGVDHDGKPKANYEPGADLLAKIVILGEGPRGMLAKQAIPRLGSTTGRNRKSTPPASKSCGNCPTIVSPQAPSFTRSAIRCRRKPSVADSFTA